MVVDSDSDLFPHGARNSAVNLYYILELHIVGVLNSLGIDIDHIIGGIFDRDVEDYSLTVTSAGLDQPFKVLEQYIKFIGSEVEVVVKGGGKMKGILTAATEEGFELTTTKMVKVEGSKKKVEQSTVTPFAYDGIKSCKPVIKFK